MAGRARLYCVFVLAWFQSSSADFEFAGFILIAFPADIENDPARGTVGFLLKIAVVAIRLRVITADFLKTLRGQIPLFSLEIFLAGSADRIEAGFAFVFEWITAPVQVGHTGIL